MWQVSKLVNLCIIIDLNGAWHVLRLFHNLLGNKCLSTMLPAAKSNTKLMPKSQKKKTKKRKTKKQTGSNWVVVLLSAIVTFEQLLQWAPPLVLAHYAVGFGYYVGLVRFGFLGTCHTLQQPLHPHTQTEIHSIFNGFCNDSFHCTLVSIGQSL